MLYPAHDYVRMKKMTATIEWVNDSRRVIVHTYLAEATLDDYHRLVDENRLMMTSVPHEVDLIMDISRLRTVPPRFLSALLVADKKVPDNQRLLIIVGASPYARIWADISRRVAPKITRNMYLTETREQADLLIAQHPHTT